MLFTSFDPQYNPIMELSIYYSALTKQAIFIPMLFFTSFSGICYDDNLYLINILKGL